MAIIYDGTHIRVHGAPVSFAQYVRIWRSKPWWYRLWARIYWRFRKPEILWVVDGAESRRHS